LNWGWAAAGQSQETVRSLWSDRWTSSNERSTSFLSNGELREQFWARRTQLQAEAARVAAAFQNVDVAFFEASTTDQIESAVVSAARAGHEALLVIGGGLTARNAELIAIARVALSYGINFALRSAGGLVTYGVELR
jgi:hypothetical protein